MVKTRRERKKEEEVSFSDFLQNRFPWPCISAKEAFLAAGSSFNLEKAELSRASFVPQHQALSPSPYVCRYSCVRVALVESVVLCTLLATPGCFSPQITPESFACCSFPLVFENYYPVLLHRSPSATWGQNHVRLNFTSHTLLNSFERNG